MPATKMMSFVERRQIYLTSNIHSQDKQDPKKLSADAVNVATVDHEVKPNIRTFNLASAEKNDCAAGSAQAEALATPR